MKLYRDGKTGYWNRFRVEDWILTLRTHAPDECVGPVCDIHARGGGPEARLPLNWRGDRKMMEVLCEHGIGHPTRAQEAYWRQHLSPEDVRGELVHGCDGCCADWRDRYVS